MSAPNAPKDKCACLSPSGGCFATNWPEFQSSRFVGEYKLEKKLGSGSYATVHKARCSTCLVTTCTLDDGRCTGPTRGMQVPAGFGLPASSSHKSHQR
jgi:hypothetical protein